jgi:hypothetical protein
VSANHDKLDSHVGLLGDSLQVCTARSLHRWIAKPAWSKLVSISTCLIGPLRVYCHVVGLAESVPVRACLICTTRAPLTTYGGGEPQHPIVFDPKGA